MNLQEALEAALTERRNLVTDGHEVGAVEPAELAVAEFPLWIGVQRSRYWALLAGACLHAMTTSEEPVVGRSLDEWLADKPVDEVVELPPVPDKRPPHGWQRASSV